MNERNLLFAPLLLVVCVLVGCVEGDDECGRLERNLEPATVTTTVGSFSSVTGTVDCWCETAQMATCVYTVYDGCTRRTEALELCAPVSFQELFGSPGETEVFGSSEMVAEMCAVRDSYRAEPGSPCS